MSDFCIPTYYVRSESSNRSKNIDLEVYGGRVTCE